MTVKRSELEIIHDILVVIRDSNLSSMNYRGSIKPTLLLSKSNLSHPMLLDYIQRLMDAGLVKKLIIKKSRLYSITDRAHIYLKDYMVVEKFILKYNILRVD